MIIDVLNSGGRPMRPKEIALILGKRDGTIRKMLYEMKRSNLILATGQGYISLIPKNIDIFDNVNEDNAHNGGNSDEDLTVYGHWEYAKSCRVSEYAANTEVTTETLAPLIQ